MKRLAWLTDIHLEFVTAEAIDAFCDRVADAAPDALLVGGDTGTASSFTRYLLSLEKRLRCPIYFVLGNHDFYGGSIATVRTIAAELTRSAQWLHWLAVSGVVPLTATTGLIGHGSWADGRLGSAQRSQVMLNDYYQIREFIGLSAAQRFALLNALGDEAATHFRRVLPLALEHFRRVLLLTHMSPFRESCRYGDSITGDEFLPHFSCKAVGDVLIEAMQSHPDRNLTVLCGHTHTPARVQVLPNLHVKAGSARYGAPRLQEVIAVE